MSEELENTDEGHDKLRRFLKSLQPVKASPDFELRLERRLADVKSNPEEVRSEGRSRSWWKIPLVTYPAAALLLVGVISYFTLRRSDVLPPATKKEIPSINTESHELRPSPSRELDTRAEEDRESRAPSDRRVLPEDEKNRVGPQSIQNVEQGEGNRIQRGKPMNGIRRELRNLEVEVAPSQKNIDVQLNAVQKRFRAEESQSPPIQLQASPAAKSRMMAPVLEDASLEFRTAADSIALLDSLRADSLRQIELQAAPKPKPDN